MSVASVRSRREDALAREIRAIPSRVAARGFAEAITARVHLAVVDLGHTWELRLRDGTAKVRRGPSRADPDVVLASDAASLTGLLRGELAGIELIVDGRLTVRGSIDTAVTVEAALRPDTGPLPPMHAQQLRVGSQRMAVLSSGEGPDVVCIHGLGASRTSFLELGHRLSATHRVHLVDLPGFGASSTPVRAPYDAPWFADHVLGVLDQLKIDRAHLVGNSMGGRVAIEAALQTPERIASLGLLAPAVAFVRRGFHPLVRLARPELGVLPHSVRRGIVERQLLSFFAEPDAIDPALADAIVEEFRTRQRSPAARAALYSSARRIYLDAPFGRDGFYPRLSRLDVPALFAWGSHDRLVPAAFSRHVTEWCPQAQQVVLEGCGHVPQVEHPELTTELLAGFIGHVDGAQPMRRRRLRRVAAA
ncbi:MAG: alpha/beta fold hydrolase [Solirubrobacteraceae bacterium]|nr:alpha/beta fold hydrolase [Solirubrobacteraceae bacterium]